jgi:hypothetical protein
MPNVAGPIPQSARLYDQLLSSGVVFTSGSSYVSVIRLGQGHATSGVNGIDGSTPDGRREDPSSPIVISFFKPGDPFYPSKHKKMVVKLIKYDGKSSAWNPEYYAALAG